jgi:hypothetical protein
MSFASAGNGETPHPSYTATRQESHHAKAPQELYACREGRHPAAPSDRPRTRLRPLRRASVVADVVLPLAEAVFESGTSALERKNGPPESHYLRTIAALREKLQRKNEVVAELMEEHTQPKKELGEL